MPTIKLKTKIPDLDKSPIRLNKDLTISKDSHKKLLRHCLDRMDAARDTQKSACDRYESIDKEVYGFIRLTNEDKQRQLDNEKGIGPKPYDINLQTVRTQIHEAITYMMGVYFPPEGPYTAIAPNDKLDIAKGLSTLMNQHAEVYKHYTATAKGLFDAFKYNISLWSIDWEETRGIEVGTSEGGLYKETKDALLSDGNRLKYQDPYNTYLDPSVHPTLINEQGEFWGQVEIKTEFFAKRMQASGKIYNLDRRSKDRLTVSYYKEKPDILGDAVKGSFAKTDWLSFLSATEGSNVLLKDSVEFVTMNIWLPVDEFGIAMKDLTGEKTTGYQIWRIIIANASVIVAADPVVNAHGLLNLICSMPWDDNFARETTGFAEVLFPFQRFASFQMNVHQQAQRKKLNGLMFYDEKVFPGLKDADSSGKVPFNSQNEQFDVRKALFPIFDAPDTDNTIRDIASMEDLMQKMLPTQQANQVASLERATQYQAAATVQSGNKRNLLLAIIMDEQAFSPGRKMQLYNVMQFQRVVQVFDKEGNRIEIDPKTLREQKFEFLIGSGLRGLDKLVIQETLSNMLFAIIQSPTASTQVDVVALMNFITTTMGDYTDLNQFKFKNEFDRLTPEQKQQAFGLLQSALQAQGDEENATAQ